MLLYTGDDVIPRATFASLRRLEKRLIEYVPTDGDGGSIYVDYAK